MRASAGRRARALALLAATLALAVAPRAHAAASQLTEAISDLGAGEYVAAVGKLRAYIDAGARDLVAGAQALRIYGIAWFLTGRAPAARGAFLTWLRLEPRARLDPALVRPEVVAFFEKVRVENR